MGRVYAHFRLALCGGESKRQTHEHDAGDSIEGDLNRRFLSEAISKRPSRDRDTTKDRKRGQNEQTTECDELENDRASHGIGELWQERKKEDGNLRVSYIHDNAAAVQPARRKHWQITRCQTHRFSAESLPGEIEQVARAHEFERRESDCGSLHDGRHANRYCERVDDESRTEPGRYRESSEPTVERRLSQHEEIVGPRREP